MKCGRITCKAEGVYQPLIRIRASILPANGKDVLATIRPQMCLCMRHRLEAADAEIIAIIPAPKMLEVIAEARRRTGAAPNPDRTMVHWVKIQGRRTNG